MTIEVDNVILPKTTHHSKKRVTFTVNGKTIHKLADTDALNQAKDFWTQLLLPHRPKEPLLGPVCLTVTLRWPHNKSASKAFKSRWQWHTSKPDCSNMVKTIEDRLVQLGFMRDDGQVCSLVVNKFWSQVPGFKIEIVEVTQ